ncbi:hypothetical protein C6A85_17780, partial [Mycobacterium sp. ITM-2017-0098]
RQITLTPSPRLRAPATTAAATSPIECPMTAPGRTPYDCKVRAGAVIGHSMGEVAAAVVAGALSLGDGVKVICRRSRLMQTIAGG